MCQLEPLERRAVVGERHLVLGSAIEELEHAFRKPLLRGLAQVEDVVAVVQAAHSRFLLSPNDDSGSPCVNTERIDPRETFGVLFELTLLNRHEAPTPTFTSPRDGRAPNALY